MIKTKQCSKCKKIKLLSKFDYDGRTRDKYAKICIQCYQFRFCRGCNKIKSLDAFHKDRRTRDDRVSRYKKCVSRWKRENQNADKKIDWNMKSMYGIGLREYNKMHLAQEDKCAICGSEDVGRKDVIRFAIDHCHETGKIRGLLCAHCNKALGCMKDNPDLLRKAADYLEMHHDKETSQVDSRENRIEVAASTTGFMAYQTSSGISEEK